MDTHTEFAAIILGCLYIGWLCAATLLYRKIDARFAGIVPTFRSHLQLFTDGPSFLAFLRFLIRGRAKDIGDAAMYRQVNILRFLTMLLLLSWGYFMYLALHSDAP